MCVEAGGERQNVVVGKIATGDPDLGESFDVQLVFVFRVSIECFAVCFVRSST